MSRYLFVLFASVLLLLGCNTISVDSADLNAHLIQGVPMVRQVPMQCGAASMAMVLQYHGIASSAGEIHDQMDKGQSGGVGCGAMRRFASGIAGVQATSMVSHDPQTIKAAVDRNMPVIARVTSESGRRGCHYVVVAGYTAEGFVINDPNVGQRFMDYPTFRNWSHCDYFRCPPHWLLIVEPKT